MKTVYDELKQKGPGKKWDSRTTDKNTVDNINVIPAQRRKRKKKQSMTM